MPNRRFRRSRPSRIVSHRAFVFACEALEMQRATRRAVVVTPTRRSVRCPRASSHSSRPPPPPYRSALPREKKNATFGCSGPVGNVSGSKHSGKDCPWPLFSVAPAMRCRLREQVCDYHPAPGLNTLHQPRISIPANSLYLAFEQRSPTGFLGQTMNRGLKSRLRVISQFCHRAWFRWFM